MFTSIAKKKNTCIGLNRHCKLQACKL